MEKAIEEKPIPVCRGELTAGKNYPTDCSRRPSRLRIRATA
jgi:hypothetical protein